MSFCDKREDGQREPSLRAVASCRKTVNGAMATTRISFVLAALLDGLSSKVRQEFGRREAPVHAV